MTWILIIFFSGFHEVSTLSIPMSDEKKCIEIAEYFHKKYDPKKFEWNKKINFYSYECLRIKDE